jgi:parvulin-like peptidyl-prolyl isomerase
MDAAKQKADQMLAAITTEESFNTLASEYAPESDKDKYKDKNATLTEKDSASSLGEDMKNWLFDDARKAGDKTVLASDTDYTVLYMIKRYREEENTVDVRHILIQPEVSEGASEATDAQKAAAKQQAEALYEEWKSGAATEDSFAELAKKNSSDTGSSSEGGLYQSVYPGQMTEAFENWCFDAARKPGDTGIVRPTTATTLCILSGLTSRTGW